MGSTPKKKIEISKDNIINAGATDITTGPIVSSGKSVRINVFGGFDPVSGDGVHSVIVLQWGKSGDWETLRAGGGGSFEFNVMETRIGDGTKRFRVIRKNMSSSNKEIVYWVRGLINEPV